ncbi:MAG: hypothetical protein ABIJ18_03325 [archaeon]
MNRDQFHRNYTLVYCQKCGVDLTYSGGMVLDNALYCIGRCSNGGKYHSKQLVQEKVIGKKPFEYKRLNDRL